MTSFVAAYVCVWVFVALYVFRLRANHARLTRRLQALEETIEEQAREDSVRSAA